MHLECACDVDCVGGGILVTDHKYKSSSREAVLMIVITVVEMVKGRGEILFKCKSSGCIWNL